MNQPNPRASRNQPQRGAPQGKGNGHWNGGQPSGGDFNKASRFEAAIRKDHGTLYFSDMVSRAGFQALFNLDSKVFRRLQELQRRNRISLVRYEEIRSRAMQSVQRFSSDVSRLVQESGGKHRGNRGGGPAENKPAPRPQATNVKAPQAAARPVPPAPVPAASPTVAATATPAAPSVELAPKKKVTKRLLGRAKAE